MKVAVITEVSTKSRNADIIQALEGRDLEVCNVGMTGIGEEEELSYIHTSFMTAVLLNTSAVDFVIGGCGTGEGFAIAANMYPGVYCGHIYDPLEAWLFPQINAGKAISLVLNKQYGWAAEKNLKFIFDALFDAPIGGGFPTCRKEPQRAYREELEAVSRATHRDSLVEIMQHLDAAILKRCGRQKAFMALLNEVDESNEVKRCFMNVIGE